MLTNSACDENIDFGKIQKLGKIPNGNSVLFFVWKEQKKLKFAKSTIHFRERQVYVFSSAKTRFQDRGEAEGLIILSESSG
jgi:mannose/cellobiose epimerase-like protein (N-acyl-D-glucosamine 2-epimerase family)